MPRNIEMNVLNNGEYEILYPQTLSECVVGLLSDETKVLMGLTSENTPDDAFRELYLSIVLDGRALINFTVMGNDGTPCKGVQLASSNFCDGNGNKLSTVTTDDNGKISVFVDAASVNVTCNNYANFEAWSNTYSVTFGEQYDENVTLNRRNFYKISSSGNYMFSPEIIRIDVSVGGGGGGGGRGGDSGGGGGGGGFSAMQENVDFISNTLYSAIIGAGGQGSQGYPDATSGGTSSFMNITGNGGNIGTDGDVGGNGGSGNGRGGSVGEAGTDGTTYIYISFSSQDLYGGGGGGATRTGGKNGGGDGGPYSTTTKVVSGESGINGLGGGGGGGGYFSSGTRQSISDGGNGGSGCVAIRMYTAETLPA